MSTKTNLHIADPCHENWQNMTSTEQGKFCQSCRKEVIDFSLLSDKQILDYFSKHKGSTCGRFRDDQLNRPLDTQPAKSKAPFWKWFVTLGLGIWFNSKAISQTVREKSNAEPMVQVTDTTEEVVTMGMYARAVSVKKKDSKDKIVNVKGRVFNDANEPVSGASISLNGKDYTSSAIDGTFSIHTKIPGGKDNVDLSISYIGYETKNVKVSYDNKTDLHIQLMPKASDLAEVVVTGYGKTVGKVVLGQLSVTTIVTDTIKATLKKIKGNDGFNVYPNPVRKGGVANIQIKEEGDYSMQLISNASQIISSQKVNATKNQLFQLQMSLSLASGIYYVRMVNEETGAQYTDKVVVL